MTDKTELERQAFEQWFKREWHPDKTGPYAIDKLWFAYKAGWQARANLEKSDG